MGFSDARFDVNLSILFTELPLLERPAAAAAAGFTAVELWWPWTDAPVPAPRQLDALRDALRAAGTQLVGLNFYAGQLPGPDRGALSVPGEESERFRANVAVAADFAQSLGCTALNALYGNRVQGVAPAAQDALALENLTLAARAAHREDLEEVIDRYTPLTGHVQIADSPGRGAPGTGTLPFEDLLDRLRTNGYAGWTGLEYQPGEAPSAEAFAWLPRPHRAATH
ncbi:TIM barrel protein [Streptomyces rimosus]|uniref:TIM barrel protein n=1 Tax=Streptomyces rimosus TaxID=1927 RepID=UPI0004CB48E3|nr:TIM barrel protein [Streptomyces rimosus]